jgi:hypothetical protein
MHARRTKVRRAEKGTEVTSAPEVNRSAKEFLLQNGALLPDIRAEQKQLF